jgi:hypothetical protein
MVVSLGTTPERMRSPGMHRPIRNHPRPFPPHKRWRIRRESDDDDDDVIVAGGGAEEKQTGESTG